MPETNEAEKPPVEVPTIRTSLSGFDDVVNALMREAEEGCSRETSGPFSPYVLF
jgi:hypothetical protein